MARLLAAPRRKPMCDAHGPILCALFTLTCNVSETSSLAWAAGESGRAWVIGYRLYCMSGGQIVSTTAIEAENDVAATEAARAERPVIDCELWCDARLVAFIPAVPEKA